MVCSYYILNNDIHLYSDDENDKYIIDENFKKYTIVELVTVINNCYLVENIVTKNRKWIMNYYLYLLNNNINSDNYKKEILKNVPDKFYKTKDHEYIVELLEIVNNDIYKVKYLENNKIENISKYDLIKINDIL